MTNTHNKGKIKNSSVCPEAGVVIFTPANFEGRHGNEASSGGYKQIRRSVVTELTKAGYPSTATESTGFYSRENVILFVGVADSRDQAVLKIIGDSTKSREESVPSEVSVGDFKLPSHIKVGGAVVFVLPVDQFVKL